MPERSALYRRYRPQTFSAIVGQEHVTRTLRNAIAAGQVSHAYLLAGSRGIGKTTIARLIAKAVNCTKTKDGEPCDRCENCIAIREGRFLDLIEIDAASNRGIDEMRDLREKVRFAPSQGQSKVYVIDEAHQLTNEAFNALLKTLEEPPPHVIFVLATTEAGKIPGTIVSRTQRFDLRRIPYKGMVEQLAAICAQEKLTAEPAALEAIARHAQGSLRDAESILDMVATFSDGKVTLADVDELLGVSEWEETSLLFDAFAANDGAAGVRLVGRLVDEGRDLRLFVKRAFDHMRALVLLASTGKPPETASEGVALKLKEQSPKFTLERLARIAKRLLETESQLRTSEGTPLPLELAILDLTTPPASAGATPPAGRTTTAPPARTVSPPPARTASAPAREVAPPASADTTRATVRESAPTTMRPDMTRAAPGRAATAAAPRTDQSPPIDLAARRAQNEKLTLVDVRRAWAELVAQAKAQNLGKAAHLNDAEVLSIDGTTAVIGFASDFARAFWHDRLRAELERGLSERLSLPLKVRCVVQAIPANAPPVSDDPMHRAALEIFRRPDRIMEIE
ncbi:MAG TPA: DNA polymerase III subunit gamma/tau [Candidatus Limnocylindrales bacterium]|nr:DNA polymerase III subunit gamma/tau [Candidatus Limnocylindrales bacterium]